jgi:sulfite exporter TauE/SafE
VNTSAVIAMLVGLLSAAHCVGMCGGIVGALGFSLQSAKRQRPNRLFALTLAYNAGRVLSYSVAGTLLGGIGVAVGDSWAFIGFLLRTVSALVTVAIGLFLMGIWPRLAAIERMGEPIWHAIEPLGRRLLPIHSLGRALAFGLVWGWLPCGLVYAMLLNAPAQGSAVAGGIYMAMFGIGTLPVMVGSGLVMVGLRNLLAHRAVAILGGALVVLMGLYSLVSQTL